MMRFILIISLLAIFSACKKENNQISTSMESFPNQVGDQWIYQLTEANDSVKTIQVDIVGSYQEIVSGQTVTIWRYDSPKYFGGTDDYVDTNYVATTGDTIKIFQDKQLQDQLLQYIFPITVGQVLMTGSCCRDTARVNAIENVTVPAGNFTGSFQISKTLFGIDVSYNDSTWLKEGKGIVKRHQMDFGEFPIPGNGIWELVSYHLE